MKQIREQLNKLDHYCIDNDLHFYDFRSLYEAIEPNLKPQEKNELKQFLSNPNIKLDDVQNKLNSLQNESFEEYDDDAYDAWQMGRVGGFNKYPFEIEDEPLPFDDDYDLDEAIKGKSSNAGAEYYYGNAASSDNAESDKIQARRQMVANTGSADNAESDKLQTKKAIQQQKGRGYDPDANPNGIKKGTNWDPDSNPSGIKKEPVRNVLTKTINKSSDAGSIQQSVQQNSDVEQKSDVQPVANTEQSKGPGDGTNYNDGQTRVIGFDKTKDNFGRYKAPNNESLKEALNGIEEECKQKFDEVQNILMDGVKNGNTCEEIDCANRVRQAFAAVGGRVRIVYNTPTYVQYDGSVLLSEGEKYTIGGSISGKVYEDGTNYILGDLNRLAEDLTMAYNVKLGGQREYTPGFIKRITNESLEEDISMYQFKHKMEDGTITKDEIEDYLMSYYNLINADPEHGWEMPAYEKIAHKMVYDSDGFRTDYTMYQNTDTGEYVCVFGDSDIYRPEDEWWDAGPFDTEEEAYEWFNSYNGFEDELDESLNEKLVSVPEDKQNEFEELLNSFGYQIEKKGKTFMGSIHYQVINPDIVISSEDEWNERASQELRPLIDAIDDFEEANNMSITWNFGVNKDYQMTAGMDLHDMWIEESLHESKDYDMKYYCCSYFDNRFRGLEDDFNSDDMDEVKDWVWDKSNQGLYTTVYNGETGNTTRMYPDDILDSEGEFSIDDGEYRTAYVSHDINESLNEDIKVWTATDIVRDIYEKYPEVTFIDERDVDDDNVALFFRFGGNVNGLEDLVKSYGVDYRIKDGKMKIVAKEDEFYESLNESDDGAWSYDEVMRELSKITNKGTKKSGSVNVWYESEKEHAKNILKKFYKVVEVSDGRMSKDEDMNWVIAYSTPLKKNESYLREFAKPIKKDSAKSESQEVVPFLSKKPNMKGARKAGIHTSAYYDLWDFIDKYYCGDDVIGKYLNKLAKFYGKDAVIEAIKYVNKEYKNRTGSRSIPFDAKLIESFLKRKRNLNKK